ncbi:hypothetical protein Tco_0377293 [Tanacetum coccineum]
MPSGKLTDDFTAALGCTDWLAWLILYDSFFTITVAQQKHGRPITHRFHKSKYFITQVLSESEEILLAVIKRCNLGNK